VLAICDAGHEPIIYVATTSVKTYVGFF
jgi:hypothetical protein